MGVFNPSGFISGTYDYLSGTASTVEYLVVGGGGAGGSWWNCTNSSGQGGGGGGAGGVLNNTGYPITPGTSITVTIGAGGTGTLTGNTTGVNGSNSVFGSLTAIGGGGGARAYGGRAGSGGSGGGSSSGGALYGYGTPGQGNNGGGNGCAVGGGGGAGGVGLSSFNNSTTMGGTGITATITGTPIQLAGGGNSGSYISYYYMPISTVAGGGQGATQFPSGLNNNATNATANTGSGGGGGAGSIGNSFASGSGGSGIVVIRYPANLNAPVTITGGPQILYNNGYQIYVWTSSGTVTF